MREIFDYILSLLKSRILPLVLVFVVLVTILINRLFSLQIINGESYKASLTDSVKKDMSVAATRGRIYDRNGVLLAYNDLAFAVKISDSGKYSDSNGRKAIDIKNETINNAIDKTLTIIEQKGDKYSNDLPIEYVDGTFAFTAEGTTLLRFLRDTYGRKAISELSEEERNATAQKVFEYLCNQYGVNLEKISIEHGLVIVNLRRYMSANSYNRYMSFVIANEVSSETVAAILENSDELVGVTVEEQYIRRYVDSVYCSQILGYTGTVSTSELADLQSQRDTYESNDIVGKAGIEKSYELELSGTKGSQEVYVDSVGRITEVVNETEATAGHDIYLTIDVNLQKKIYDAIEDQLVQILLSNMSNGDTKYTYNSSGDVTNIYITAKEIYYALIDNNLVSTSKIATGTTQNSQEVYSAFVSKKDSVNSWIRNELTVGNTAYGKLTDEQKIYIWYVYTKLCKDKVFNTSNVDISDETYKNWIDENNTSLKELLTYGISKGWVDMSTLSQEQYTSLQESYDVLVDYIMSVLDTDSDFFKKIYKYMIDDGNISGRQICMLLFEQGTLDPNAEGSNYQALASGSMSAYNFMVDAISTKKITPGQLALKPCSGSAVITNPQNGDVLALVSYPSYDNNKLSGTIDSEYYNSLIKDKASPLLNYATQSKTAPGSTFKPCTAIAGLDTGIISTGTVFNCSGSFDKVTPAPRCWKTYGHGGENVSTAIRDSCNVFFYNVGYNIACSRNGSYDSEYGTSVLQKYSDMLGLSTKTGIEIEESAPKASNEVAFSSAIGQGTHEYSSLNLARYVTTLATSGTCYNLTLIDKITDTDGNVLVDNSAKVDHNVQLSSEIWNAVHSGMQMAGASYTSLNRLNLKIAAKSGTAQEGKKDPDHSLLITYAPYDNPEICTSVSLKNGYSSTTSMDLTATIYKIYYGME